MMFHTLYNPPAAVGVSFEGDPGLTQQHFKQECDVNSIIDRYSRGVIEGVPHNPPKFGDFSQVVDYPTAFAAARETEVAFMALPAKIRREFDNSPAALLAFLDNPANKDKAMELGLIEKPKEKQVL